MAKITAVTNGESGATARAKINTAVASVETSAKLSGDGNVGTALDVVEAQIDLNNCNNVTSAFINSAGAPVQTVNTQSGAVVLDADDISDAVTTNKFVTAADLTTLSNTSGTNTGDQTSVTGTSGNTDALNSATTVVDVSAATAPTVGQVLTATGSTAATWQDAGGGGGGNFSSNEFTESSTWNAVIGTEIVQTIIDCTDTVSGEVSVEIDGSETYTVQSGSRSSRIVKSSSSIDIIAKSIGFDLTSVSYDSVSFSFASQEVVPRDLFFSTDGTKLYTIGYDTDTVYQYTLTTAWDLSTASYSSLSFSVAAQDGFPEALSFKTDGTKMYVVGNSGNDVFQYSLSTAWDVSTASYDSVLFDVGPQDVNPYAVAFKSDGTKMYISGGSNSSIFQYSLPTPWVLTGASYDSVSFSVAAQDSTPRSMYFKSDGTKLYVGGDSNDDVFQYSLSSPWDMSTASYDSISFDASSQEGNLDGIFFKTDGTKMYLSGYATDSAYQYSTEIVFSGTSLSTVNF